MITQPVFRQEFDKVLLFIVLLILILVMVTVPIDNRDLSVWCAQAASGVLGAIIGLTTGKRSAQRETDADGTITTVSSNTVSTTIPEAGTTVTTTPSTINAPSLSVTRSDKP